MKNLVALAQILFVVIISFGVSYGQTTASVYIKKYDNAASFDMKETREKNTSDDKIENKKSAIYYDISDVDMSTVVDIKTNSIDFSGEQNRKYTKMQLTEKHSNKTIISRKIDADYKININTIDPGSYMLILSNEEGEIKTEDVIIL